jgi:hypothetical protein
VAVNDKLDWHWGPRDAVVIDVAGEVAAVERAIGRLP